MKRFLVLAFVTGCAASQAKSQEDLLDRARMYDEGLRWRRYDDAAAQVHPAEREAFLDERDILDDELRIDDYEIERVKFSAKRSKAKLQVRYTWHMDSEGVVHETVVDQSWKLHGKYWLIEGEKRKRGEPMPGVQEPERKARPRAQADARNP